MALSAGTAVDVTYEPLGRSRAASLADFFERVESHCYCRYFHFAGDKNEWQARLALAPERNRAELLARAAASPPQGIVAVAGDAVVGWMSLEPARDLSKLYAQRVYRSLPCFGGERAGVYAVGCFLVEPARRRSGIGRALLRAGIDQARRAGARVLEAFPRRAEGVRNEELWTGPLGLFLAEGFEIVSDQAQYPVLRRAL